MSMLNAASCGGLAVAAALGLGMLTALAQTPERPAVSKEEVDKLRAAVEADPGDLQAHQAYLKTFAKADDAKEQYERWMKLHPRIAVIPRALGDKYGAYSPQARQYWLKAAELQPGNPEIWEALSLDASIRGDGDKQREYVGKALAADPGNLGLQYDYAELTRRVDAAASRKATLDLTRKHPKAPETVSALAMLDYGSPDIRTRIATWEQLRKQVSAADIKTAGMQLTIYHVAMMRLVDAYTQTGQYDKAIELAEISIAEKAEARLNFDRKLALARSLADVQDRMKQGKSAEARQMLVSIQDVSFHTELIKANVLDATGATPEAYALLLAFQAKTPDPQVKTALEQYGRKLSKDAPQIRRELRSTIAENSKPAPAFVLDTYTGKKVELADLKGKVVLLSFWYPACGPCRAEMPHMESGIKGIDKDKLVYLGVNGIRDQDAFVLPFMQTSRYSFTPLGGTEEMVKAYGVRGYPTNFIIDQEGRIAYSRFMIGGANETMLDLMIRSLTD